MRREYLFLFGLALLLFSCAQTSTADVVAARPSASFSRAPKTAKAPTDPPRYGFSAHIDQQKDSGKYAALMRGANATTVRDEVDWAFIEPTKGHYDWSSADKWITVAANHGLHPLLLVGTSPAWAAAPHSNSLWKPPRKASLFGSFAGRVAARYGRNGTFWKTHPSIPRVLPVGMEIWNEENIAAFWGHLPPNPVKYAALLHSAYTAIKRVDKHMTVVLGGPAPAGGYNDIGCNGNHNSPGNAQAINGINFLQDLYADGAGRSFDALGWHPYSYFQGDTAAALMKPGACSAWSQMNHTNPSARSILVSHDAGTKRIWVTENGAPTCVFLHKYHPCLSEQQQAVLATEQMSAWKSWKWAGNFYWYDIRDDGPSWGTRTIGWHFGVVRSTDTLKPAYSALKAAWS
jgi:polysaccharide biosynthesis protein PslG